MLLNYRNLKINDAEKIRIWRNNQIKILRQNKKIKKNEQIKYFKKNILTKNLKLDLFAIELNKKFSLVVYHPPQEKIESIKKHLDGIFSFLNSTKLKRIWISPNNDSGSTIIKSEFDKKRTQNDYIYDNLSRSDYLSLLCNAEFILGNSSSGILKKIWQKS